MQYLYRKATQDYRFSLMQLAQELGAPRHCRQHLPWRLAFGALCVEHGAQLLGKARVNLPNGNTTHKDIAYTVPAAHWPTFIAALQGTDLAALAPVPKPAPTVLVLKAWVTPAQAQALSAVCAALGVTCQTTEQ